LTVYSVKTGLADNHIYGLTDALFPAIWVGSRLDRGAIYHLDSQGSMPPDCLTGILV
jgi:hypothetical protein